MPDEVLPLQPRDQARLTDGSMVLVEGAFRPLGKLRLGIRELLVLLLRLLLLLLLSRLPPPALILFLRLG